jgi:hypothetical protein
VLIFLIIDLHFLTLGVIDKYFLPVSLVGENWISTPKKVALVFVRSVKTLFSVFKVKLRLARKDVRDGTITEVHTQLIFGEFGPVIIKSSAYLITSTPKGVVIFALTRESLMQLSNPSKTIFAIIGEIMPPCGTPAEDG